MTAKHKIQTESEDTAMRRALPGDAEKLKIMAQAAYGKYVSRMEKAPAPMSYDYAEWIKEGNTYVLECSGEVAAMITLLPKSDHLMMRNLAVLPAFQGRNFGRALIDFAETEARRQNLGELRVYTNEKFPETMPFYHSCGFSETHRAKVDGYSFIYLSRTLAEAASAGNRVTNDAG
jgi:GNAT superfamily N-acetyltransferase